MLRLYHNQKLPTIKTIEDYLNKGLEREYAEYFAHGRKTIINVLPISAKRLLLSFDNGEKRILDMSKTIQEDSVFAFLKSEANFNRVYLDEQHSVCWDINPDIDSNIAWDNKIDMYPDWCYVNSIPV